MKKIIDFIMKSSADPTKTSASVKYALLGAIPYIMYTADMVCRFGYECVALNQSYLEVFITGLAEAVFLVLTLLSVFGTLYGVGRKIILTIAGQNKAIQ